VWIPQRRKHEGIGRRVHPWQFAVIPEAEEPNVAEAALAGTRTEGGLIDSVTGDQETRIEIPQPLECREQIVDALASP
jgi:hypothetical protein